MDIPKITFPLALTLARLILAPLIIPFACVYLLPYQDFNVHLFVTILFLGFGVTDFFDGYLARKNSQVTALGKLLDPLADKCLMFSTFIALVYINKIYFFWAIIFIGREFYIMGLREIALYYSFSVDVMSIGKLKTFLQMLYVSFVLINPYTSSSILDNPYMVTQIVLLIAALAVTVYSAYIYTQVFIQKWKQV